MADVCYFCDAPATTKEHVPPACLFPERKDSSDGVDYRKNLITVPSCDAHNSQKTKDDEYLLLILVHGYLNNKAGRDHFNSKVVRALSRRPAMLVALYGTQTPVTVDGELTVSVDIDRVRFNNALERVCQGLCVNQYGKRWPKEIEIHTPLLLAIAKPEADKINSLVTGLSKAIIENLKGVGKNGDNPEIFWYQLLVDEVKDRLLCRVVFYENFDVFAISDPLLSVDCVSN